jgi:hypothetical protein
VEIKTGNRVTLGLEAALQGMIFNNHFDLAQDFGSSM